jgi:hypothetical protein
MKTYYRDSRKLNSAYSKLHSEKGASITFALLLFLVCAVLSAVILVAGTTASGRMSNIAETDQCYYSVTSAAELIKDRLDGQTVSVINNTVIDKPMDTIMEYDVYYDDADVKTEADEDIEPKTSDGSGTAIKASDFTVKLAESYINKGEGAALETTFTLSSSPKKDELEVSIKENMDSQGNVEFTIYNTNNKNYIMKLQFAIQEKICNPPNADPDNLPADSNNKEISWHLTDMESAYDAE